MADSTPNTTETMTGSVYSGGKYINPWPDFKLPGPTTVAKMALSYKDNSKIPKQLELEISLPVMIPDKNILHKPNEGGIQVTWIGHATVLVQMDGVNILTDPIFSDRCSPSQWFGPKRYRPVPVNISELPNIDAVVISHNHYDHLDYESVKQLHERFGIHLCWFVPIGMKQWMLQMRCQNVFEMDWWDEQEMPSNKSIKFAFTPAQHWSKRSLTDDCKTLWGSWCVITPWHNFFFAGDTGYCPVFKEIGDHYGPFDLAAIPIGAYEPRPVMKHQHVNPEEAVQIHQDIKSQKSIGIHWGTFKLTYEFYLEPREMLKKCLADKDLPLDQFITTKHGMITHIGDTMNNVD